MLHVCLLKGGCFFITMFSKAPTATKQLGTSWVVPSAIIASSIMALGESHDETEVQLMAEIQGLLGFHDFRLADR